MKVRSSKPRGQRILKSVKIHSTYDDGCKKIMYRPFWIEPINGGWFCLEKGEWQQEYNGKGNMCTSYYAMSCYGFNDVYSLKSVIRLIKKWNVPKGTVFIASLPYVGYEFYITK